MMPNESDSTPAPQNPNSKDIDATVLPNASNPESDATIAPGPRGVSEGSKHAPTQQFAPRLERIGDCKIEKRLGVGGFGEVWLATQESDLLKRRVAIKLLKGGMDSTAVQERFELERKVLNTLNHPNIARLFGGGVTEDGRSYFIMEFVEGLTLDVWCKRQNLTVTERLAIFRQVCSAVAHAHSVGIVHRDLKPANVMVTADGVPKLLDFGIAKIVNKNVQEGEAMQDMPGEMGPLTPMYASPEQWRAEPLSASTDIYSLGVILFETLTEQLPFDFSNLSMDQIRRLVCETSPSLPSEVSFRTSVSISQTQTGTPGGSSAVPEGSKARLRRKLRGDLDNIVLMAMRPEPGRRYATVEALIADLDAYASSMPVSARPSSAGYRAQKWMGRNKKKVFLATAASAALVFGIGWYVYAQIAQAEAARKAEIAQKELEEETRKKEEATKKQKEETAKRIEKDQKIFERFKALPSDFAQYPETSLPILEDYENSLRVNMKQSPDNAPLQLEIKQNLIKMLGRKSKVYIQNKNIKEGIASTAVHLDLARSVYEQTKDVKDLKELAIAMQLRGDIYMSADDFMEAKKYYEENIKIRGDICKEKPGDLDSMRDLSRASARLRDLAKAMAQWDVALRYSQEMMAFRKKLLNESKGEDPKKLDQLEYEWLSVVQWYAEDLRNLERPADAEKEIVQTLPLVKQRVAKNETANNHKLLNIWEGLLAEINLDGQEFKKALTAANRMLKAAEASLQLSNAGSRELEMFVSAAGLKALVQADMGDAEDSLDTIQSAMASANRMRDKNKQMKGDAIEGTRLLMLYSYEMRALRLLGRVDEAKEVSAKALALAAHRNEDADADWYGSKANSLSESAMLEKDPGESIRLARAAVSEADNSKLPMIQLEAYEALVQVLRQFATQQEVSVEIAKASEIAGKLKRPKASAIMKRIQGEPTQGKVEPGASPAPVAPSVAPAGSPQKAPPAQAPNTPSSTPNPKKPPKT